MISGVPLFRGRDNNDQLNQILRILGTPDESTLRRIAAESVSLLLSARVPLPPHFAHLVLTVVHAQPEIQLRPFPRMARIPFASLYPKAHPVGELGCISTWHGLS